VFLGKYRVDQILGHGGMGIVAKCHHLQLNDVVAIKMLRRDVLDDADAVERFMREAQASVKLRSEYVARVSDVGRFENGVPYMVMEFLDGHDLGELIDERGSLPVPWATELMLQAAEALAEAHSIGIVHRDVKPTNLFVTWRPDGTALIKVLDFGIARAPMGTDLKLTQTQSLLGTPAYMSPEQMRSARLVDARSDIWSLGTVMYELIEGRRPFEAESFSEMCVKVAVDPPEPMVSAPPGLAQVVLRCLAKAPEQRYATMADLGAALLPFARDAQVATRLVERMRRTLERGGHVDWAAGTPVSDGALAAAAAAAVAAAGAAPAGTSAGAAPLGAAPASPAPPAARALAGGAAAPGATPLPIPAEIVQPPRPQPRSRLRLPRGREAAEPTLKGPPQRRRALWWVLGAAALVGTSLGAVVYAVSGRPRAEPAPQAAPAPQPAPAPRPAPPPAPALPAAAVRSAAAPDPTPPPSPAAEPAPRVAAPPAPAARPRNPGRPGAAAAGSARRPAPAGPVDEPCNVFDENHRCPSSSAPSATAPRRAGSAR
jgi:serine/threonine-protein kinase